MSGRPDHKWFYVQEAYLELYQTSMTEGFAKIVNGFHPLIIFAEIHDEKKIVIHYRKRSSRNKKKEKTKKSLDNTTKNFDHRSLATS